MRAMSDVTVVLKSTSMGLRRVLHADATSDGSTRGARSVSRLYSSWIKYLAGQGKL